MKNETEFLTPKQAAAWLGITRTHLDSLGIERIRLGRKVLYKKDVLFAYIQTHTEGGQK